MSEQQATTVVANPFASDNAPATTGTNALAVEAQRVVAEIHGAITAARAYPRDQKFAMDRIIMECTRPGLAEAAVYAYPRGGEMVSGPSIRLAEAIARQWGNIQFGINELAHNPDETVMQAFAWDLETNVREVRTFTVPKYRHTKRGKTRLEDPRDVYEQNANMGARRMRGCILAVIPGDVVEQAVQQCMLTQQNSVGAPEEVLGRMVEAFESEFGVPAGAVAKRLGHRLDATTTAEVLALKRIYQSLRDGMASPGDYFDLDAGNGNGQNRSKSSADALDAALGGTDTGETASEAPGGQETAAKRKTRSSK